MNDFLFMAGVGGQPEIFYTCEGEGRYIGHPSVFMRLAMCNLTCKGFASASSPHGCDSFISWSVKNKMTFSEVFSLMEREHYIEKLRAGAIFKITGGEPLLQGKALILFIEAFIQKYEFRPYIDFETNGTIIPDSRWVTDFEASFTVSPKMSNNGDPIEKRYKPEVLAWHVQVGSCFKFVVKDQRDVNEIFEKYIDEKSISIPRKLVWLMPCCGSRDEQTDILPAIAELCKQNCFKLSPRLHLAIWDKALRV